MVEADCVQWDFWIGGRPQGKLCWRLIGSNGSSGLEADLKVNYGGGLLGPMGFLDWRPQGKLWWRLIGSNGSSGLEADLKVNYGGG